MDKIEQREMFRAVGLATAIHIHTHVTYRSVPGKRPLSGKHPCTAFQWASAHVGQNRELCLSAHGRLPETLRYSYTCVHTLNMHTLPCVYRAAARALCATHCDTDNAIIR